MKNREKFKFENSYKDLLTADFQDLKHFYMNKTKIWKYSSKL